MSKIKIQINGTGKTYKQISDDLNEIAYRTMCDFSFEGLHPQNETNPFIWVEYSPGNIFSFVAELEQKGLYQRNCSLFVGTPGIDSLPT